jgi:hypothetical protein
VARSDSRILIVYWNPYGRRMRLSTLNHLNAVCRVGRAGDVLAVNAHGGVPRIVAALRPTALILHTTFLGIRWLRTFESWRARSAWLAELDCPILALPQDDFDHSGVLDEWLESLGVCDLFTSLPDEAGILYPRTSARARVTGVLTGYVDEHLVRDFRAVRPCGANDIVYRATRLPYWFGRLGLLKAAVGSEAVAAADGLGLRSDISLRPGDAITGRDWPAFLASGRVVVGAESGSSVIDPDGRVRRAVEALLAVEPDLSYDEVTKRVDAGWDEHWFAVASPRHLEASITRTAQVLVEGRYSDVLEAGRHYVPVDRDLSNIGAAIEQALDPEINTQLTEQAFGEIAESGRYSSSRLTEIVGAALADVEVAGPPVPGRFAAARLAARAWNLFLDGRASVPWPRRGRVA